MRSRIYERNTRANWKYNNMYRSKAIRKAPKVVPNQIVNPDKIKCPENVNTLHVTQYDKANQMLDT